MYSLSSYRKKKRVMEISISTQVNKSLGKTTLQKGYL